MHAWISEEYRSLDLGDARLNRVAKSFVSQASGMGDSNPDRCRTRGSLKAVYRMVDNSKVVPKKLLAPHHSASTARCREQTRIYCVQDTTEIDLTKPEMVVEGAGSLGEGKRRGFFYHPSIAFNEGGVALGIVDEFIWTRDPASLELSSAERKAERQRACFEEKESSRWLEALQHHEQMARSMPKTRVISVADSEADISELFCQCADFPDNFDLIIRGGRQRTIKSARDIPTGQLLTGAATVDEALQIATPRFRQTVTLGARPEPHIKGKRKRVRNEARSSREAELTIRTVDVVLRGPRRPGGDSLPDSAIRVVELREQDPPSDEPAVHWVLFTTLPIETDQDVQSVIRGYTMRWGIEEFFKTLKSGLKVEDMKYQTLKRYLNAFAMLVVVAWRVEYLKTSVRYRPDAPCSEYFTTMEWGAIVAFETRKPYDESNPPSMNQFMKHIAKMGGYIDKPSQGPPGSKTLWRGMRRFEIVVEAFAAFHQMRCGV